MEKEVVWQRCPKCGQWIMGKTGLKANAADDAELLESIDSGGKVGKSIGKLFGEKGEQVGESVGKYATGLFSSPVAFAQAVFNDDGYFFECKCGHYWAASSAEEKQNAVYGAELGQAFMALPYIKRKFLFVCDELGMIPESFRVLPIDNVPSDIIFPTGHPIINTIYVCHPFRTNHYLPYETYQIELLRDEIREFKKIMAHLGARHIEYSDSFQSSEEKNASSKLEAHGKGGIKGHSVSASHDKETRSEMSKIMRSSFQGSSDYLMGDKPVLPDDLVWYHHREDWKDSCEDRLAGRTIRSEFTISTFSSALTNQQETTQIEAEYKSLIAGSASGGAKVNKSLSLKKASELSWTVKVSFYPLSDYDKKGTAGEQPAMETAAPHAEAAAQAESAPHVAPAQAQQPAQETAAPKAEPAQQPAAEAEAPQEKPHTPTWLRVVRITLITLLFLFLFFLFS